MIKLNYFTYKKEKIQCNNCNWSGYGRDLENGDMFEELIEVDCPNCYEIIGFVPFPTQEESLQFGSEDEKEYANKRNKFIERLTESELKNIDLLPDLTDKSMIFEVTESTENEDQYITISYKDQFVWKELVGYEYYERFIELGKLFKKKYGKNMIDLVPDTNGFYLYGDKFASIEIIKNFRDGLNEQ